MKSDKVGLHDQEFSTVQTSCLQCFLIVSILLVSHCLSFASCIIPGTDSYCDKIVTKLPWQFTIIKNQNNSIKILYKSLKKTQQAQIFLKITLEIKEFDTMESARKNLIELSSKVDPDMGISYAWDLVAGKEKLLYHLHADCSLSQKNFELLIHNFNQILYPVASSQPSALFCRCGGGCMFIDY